MDEVTVRAYPMRARFTIALRSGLPSWWRWRDGSHAHLYIKEREIRVDGCYALLQVPVTFCDTSVCHWAATGSILTGHYPNSENPGRIVPAWMPSLPRLANPNPRRV